MCLDALYSPTEGNSIMSLSPTEQVKILSGALQAINRRARTTYKARPYHDDEISTIGIMAEQALLNADIEVQNNETE